MLAYFCEVDVFIIFMIIFFEFHFTGMFWISYFNALKFKFFLFFNFEKDNNIRNRQIKR